MVDNIVNYTQKKNIVAYFLVNNIIGIVVFIIVCIAANRLMNKGADIWSDIPVVMAIYNVLLTLFMIYRRKTGT